MLTGIGRDHLREPQLGAPVKRHGRAHYPGGVIKQVRHCNVVSVLVRDHQVAFVLTRFVIEDDDERSPCEVVRPS